MRQNNSISRHVEIESVKSGHFRCAQVVVLFVCSRTAQQRTTSLSLTPPCVSRRWQARGVVQNKPVLGDCGLRVWVSELGGVGHTHEPLSWCCCMRCCVCLQLLNPASASLCSGVCS